MSAAMGDALVVRAIPELGAEQGDVLVVRPDNARAPVLVVKRKGGANALALVEEYRHFLSTLPSSSAVFNP